MRSVGERAARLNVPIRVVYLSNIEDYFSYTPGFRDNLLSLPTDEKGIVLRTMQNGTKEEYGSPDGEKFPWIILCITTFNLWRTYRNGCCCPVIFIKEF